MKAGITLYPRHDVALNPELPADAEFWTPEPDDIDEEEGFGYFRDVWPILNVSADEALAVYRRDKALSTLVADLATNEREFDILASVAETGSDDEVEGITGDQVAALVDHFPEAEELEGLEIGVAGLVYALAAAGMYPAASCRGHVGPNSWSVLPVVCFAADFPHAQALQPLVEDAGCGFEIDSARRDLLVVTSASIEDTLDLAQRILNGISKFPTDMTNADEPGPASSQTTLFDS